LLPVVPDYANYNKYEQRRHDEEQKGLKFVDHPDLPSALDTVPAPDLAPFARRAYPITITAIIRTLRKNPLLAAVRR
jgi:hypothetical protein